jgi:hypothetical protein
VTDRIKRKSGRVPKGERPIDGLEPLTHDALDAAVYLQNHRLTPGKSPKSRHLSRIATDLELAFIERKPKDETDRLCLDVAATALRILEQGDGH